MKRIFLSGTFLFLLLFIVLLSSAPVVCSESGSEKSSMPVYRVPLRVHLGKSERPQQEWIPILKEINSIWLSQAGICFEMHTVGHDEVMDKGMDIWFSPGKNEIYNGMYIEEHDIWTKDTPILKPASSPAHYPAARTASHELGHGLGLSHREDSDDNLMKSMTKGWQLSEEEVRIARLRAEEMSFKDRTPLHCSSPKVNE